MFGSLKKTMQVAPCIQTDTLNGIRSVLKKRGSGEKTVSTFISQENTKAPHILITEQNGPPMFGDPIPS